MAKKIDTYLRKGLKIAAWIIGSVLILFLLIAILIQLPAIQNFAKDKAVTYLEGKIKTKVSIDHIEIGFPKKVILEGFYFEDQKKDTLLFGDRLAVDISLLKLLSNEVEINSFALEGATANITRNKDSIFNFDYIIDAFASKEQKTDNSDPMKISVSKIDLDNVRFRWDDAITKNNVKVRLNHFDTEFRKFNLNEMDFDIPTINLDGLKLTLDQGLVEQIAVTSVKVADTVSKRPDFKLKLGKITLTKIDIGYDNVGTKLNTGVTVDKLLLAFKEINLNKQLIEIDRFELANVSGGLALGKYDKNISVPDVDTTAIKQEGWTFKLNRTEISNVDFKYDDNNAKAAAKGIDYKHLGIEDFNLKASNLFYSAKLISGNVASFAMKDKSGVKIESLRTDFSYGSTGASLKNLYLKTPQTLVKDEINVRYPSLERIKKDPGSVIIDANLEDSRIGFKDVLNFVPELANTDPFKNNPNAILLVNSRISGKVSDIRFPIFEISGIGSTAISASGRITGLPDVKKARFDLRINNFRSTAKDIYQFIPAGTIPNDINLPPVLAVAGSFKGAVNNFDADLNLLSSYGKARVKAKFDQRKKNSERYNADVSLDNFDLGKLIKNDSIGKISMTAKVNGKGLNPKTANAELHALLKKAEFNGYTYRNLKVDGDIKGGLFDVNADMNDPNLTFTVAANGDFNGKYPSGKLKLNVDIADLNKLNLHAGPMKLRGNVDADIQSADLDYLNGQIDIHHLQFLVDKDPILLDSMTIVAVSTAEMNSIKVKSQILKANIEGKYKLTQLASALQNSIAKYFDTQPNVAKQKTEEQHFAFDLTVDNDPIIQRLVPQITGMEPIKLSGRYNSVNDTIALKGAIPRLVYGTNTISGGNVEIQTVDNALVYSIDVDAIQNESYKLPFTRLSGNVSDNTVTYKLQIRNSEKKDQYAIAGTMKTVDGDTEIRLNPDGLLLNNERWAISPDNLIRFGKNGIYASNFELSKDENTLRIQSQSTAPNAPLEVNFANFNLGTLTNMVRKDKLLIGGTLNGNAVIKDVMTSPVFTSDLIINKFTFRGEEVGDVEIKVNNSVADTYAANVSVTGNGNLVNLDGTYKASSGIFDLDLDMQHLDVKSIQGFTSEQIKEGKGFLSGDMKITGTVEKPKLLGELQFNDVAFRVTQLNSYFKGINEKIVFTDGGISFDRFTIYDEKNNELVVNGKMLTDNYRAYQFDMTIDADNFRAVNSEAKDNDLYYGDLYLDSRLIVKGTLETPVVSGNVKINEDTKLSVVLPQSDPAIADREGIVEFVDEDNKLLQETMIMRNTLDVTGVKGVEVSVNIEIDKEAELSLIIDKGNGDYLKLKGEANLTGGIDPSGKTTLTGKYEFTEGSYEMTFNLIRRKFDIKSGSFIIWNGEPTSANINITAIYEANVPPIDLIADQLGSVSPAVRNTYKQRLPFQAELKMTGELLKPIINFDIVLPEGNYGVSSDIVEASQNKLEQLRQEPAELNKQVFSLLLLNRFVGENPFASEAGSGSAESLARQSVSKILSQQLNNIAGELIKGVELNFDLEATEDYTTGVKENRTDLNVAVSKKLLNDRLKISVGSSFGLEGEQQQNQQANTIAGDLSADYQLTKDGRYVVRVYNKNEYQVALQGQVVETGVAFIITMDYNLFRELFHRTEEEKEMIKRNRERQKREKEKEQKEKEEELKAEKQEKSEKDAE